MTIQRDYDGGCHCGAIGFRYSTATPPAEWSVRACQCSFCRAHDALSTSEPAATIEFIAHDSGMLQKYRFGLHTADFLLCRNCGVYIGAVIEVDDTRFGIINTHALRPVPETIAGVAPISYDTENTDDRISRRQLRWAQVSSNL